MLETYLHAHGRLLNNVNFMFQKPISVAARSKARTVFARSNRIPLEAWMFVCVLCAFILCLPLVDGGKNTSTVIPVSRKRRQNANPVVSGETVPADLRKG
jgi:hypothetical protein